MQTSPSNRSTQLFSGIRFVLLGFDPIKKSQVSRELVNGGAVDAGQYGPNCTHVIVDKLVYDDRVCVAARRDGKILVSSLWIDHSFDVGAPADTTSVMYRPVRDLNGIPGAKSLVICLTGYQREEREDIMTMVELMGAQFIKPLIANKVTHLICYKFEGEKYLLAKKMKRIKVINHLWLEDCLKAWEIVPEADYRKSGYELEMEAEAKDSISEDELEGVTARQSKRKIATPPQSLITLLNTSASKVFTKSNQFLKPHETKNKHLDTENVIDPTCGPSNFSQNLETNQLTSGSPSKSVKRKSVSRNTVNDENSSQIQTCHKSECMDDETEPPEDKYESNLECETASRENVTKKGKKKTASLDNKKEVVVKREVVKSGEDEPMWFILTGHKFQRRELEQIIKRLKGRVCRVTHQWSYQATHFVVPGPVLRTEKFFAAAASGRWILKTDYLTASKEAGRLLAEEPYEWYKNGLTEDGQINLEAPRKWRLLKEKTGHGAFYGMKIIVYGECIAPPLDTLKRVVKAGDGTILATSPPYTRFLNTSIDFAVVSPGMPRVDIWVEEFLKHEIPCVYTDYLVEYVCKPGYPLDKHVQYDTNIWAERSYNKLRNQLEEESSGAGARTLDGDDVACEVCGSRDRGEEMLICGDEGGLIGCGVGTHIDCCDPPLEDVPEEDWFCGKCSKKGKSGSSKRKGYASRG